MFGKNKIFGKQANDEGVQFDFSGGETTEETTETTEETTTVEETQTEEITNTEEVNTEETVEGSTNTETETEEKVETTEETSSLNTEETTVEETTTETTEVVQPEVTEEMLLQTLSEKLGREISSFDDLTPQDPLAGNEYVKGLLEWQNKTGRPIEDYVKFQKNFDEVADIDIAREYLQIKYPTLNADEIQFELERNFIADEDDLDSDAKLKNLELKKFATEGRTKLNELRMDLGKPNPQAFTAEVQEKLDFATKVQEQIEANNKFQEQYTADATKAVGTVESIELPLGETKLNFKVETSKEVLTDMVLNASHWKNEDGSTNHAAVARDAAILANFEKMLQIAYEQGKSSGTDEVIQETKNTTLGDTVTSKPAQAQSGKGIEVEGLDKYLGKTGMTFGRFRK